MTSHELATREYLQSQEVLDCVRDYFGVMQPTHFVNINPCLSLRDEIAIEGLVRSGLSRVIDRLPKYDEPMIRFVLLRELNAFGQIHYHGWLVAGDRPDLPMDTCASKWITSAMCNHAETKLQLIKPLRPNLEICRIGEHPHGSTSNKVRTVGTAHSYPLKVRTALRKHEGIIIQ